MKIASMSSFLWRVVKQDCNSSIYSAHQQPEAEQWCPKSVDKANVRTQPSNTHKTNMGKCQDNVRYIDRRWFELIKRFWRRTSGGNEYARFMTNVRLLPNRRTGIYIEDTCDICTVMVARKHLNKNTRSFLLHLVNQSNSSERTLLYKT